MKLIINNVGKVRNADINLDGITVICGDNNSGKSTVGKVLFAFFNAMCDFQNKIEKEKHSKIASYFSEYYFFKSRGTSSRLISNPYEISSDLLEYINKFNGEFTNDDIFDFLVKNSALECNKDMANDIFSIVSTPNDELFNEYIFRYFMDIFNGQLKTETSRVRSCSIETIFSSGTNKIRFYSNKCHLNQSTPILHPAYYIDNPFVLNYLNVRLSMRQSSELDRNIILAIRNAKYEQSADKMVDIFDSVANKKKLDDVRDIIKKAYIGNTVIKNGM